MKYLAATLALLVLAAGDPAAARGGPHHRDPNPAASCGFVGGALADPAATQRCLEDHYKPAAAARRVRPPQRTLL